MVRVIQRAAFILALLAAQRTLVASAIYTFESTGWCGQPDPTVPVASQPDPAVPVVIEPGPAQVIEVQGNPIGGSELAAGLVPQLASDPPASQAPEPRTTLPVVAIGAAGLIYARARRRRG